MNAYMRHLLALLASTMGFQATVSTDANAQDPESQAWNAAKQTGTRTAIEQFLAEYPVGAYSREAFREMIRLSDEPDQGGTDPVEIEIRDQLASQIGTLY